MLIFSFFLASTVLFLQGVNLPPIPINPFAPWIALAVLRYRHANDFIKPLGASACAGFLVDLLSDHPVGLYPISYTLAATILFRFRNRFLYDQPLHLAVFSSFSSLVSTLLQLFFLFLFDRRVPISGQWVFLDWLGMSFVDGIYAFVWFAGPLFLLAKARRMWVLFWLKKKHSRA